MPVYNGEKFLREAIDSIFAQTFTDFEFLIINDASTDNSVDIIQSYSDPRIRLLHNDAGRGLSAALNMGLDAAQGEYIARMDCDDISLPRRLATEVAFMDDHPEIGVCGAWFKLFDETTSRVFKLPTEPDRVKSSLFFSCSFCHGSVIMRKTFLRKHGLHYNETYNVVVDYEFWVRCAKCLRLANIGQVLYLLRRHATSITALKLEEHKRNVERIRLGLLEELGFSPESNEWQLYRRIIRGIEHSDRELIDDTQAFIQAVIAHNDKLSVFPEPAFSRELVEFWFNVCYNASDLGWQAWRAFYKSDLSSKISVPLFQVIKFALKCAAKWS